MTDARTLVTRLAAGAREAGGAEVADARREVAAFLAGLGYEVETQPFRFSPDTLQAIPILGAGLGGLAVLMFPLLMLQVPEKAALGAWLLGVAAVAALAIGVGLGWLTPGSETREDANLIAR
ncbi:MAG TPA: hypothetical protein VFX50_08315, partial [Gemmatimonadales bacterium]|nr:hypothetical protein [Gemmatimonadales bacterium]